MSSIRTDQSGGVWALVRFDDGWHVHSVYKDEISALRAANGDHGEARFLEYGKEFSGYGNTAA